MLKDLVFKLKARRYRKAFEEWFESGNRVLWVEEVLFIVISVTAAIPRHQSRIQFWGYGGKQNFYNFGTWDTAVFGELIAKGIITERIRKSMYRVSKGTFIRFLAIYDKMAIEDLWGMRYKFSFASIDFNQLPDWLVAKLVEYKLSE